MFTEGMKTSLRDDWATPQWLFDKLNDEFHFDLDPCANEQNHKCENYFTKEQDGLTKKGGGWRVFCNPPYGRQIGKWMQKCCEEGRKTLVVALVPARTDTKWFHEYVLGKAEIRFIKGRLSFDEQGRAPFPSMIVIYRGNSEK